jgi:hypothetical protein
MSKITMRVIGSPFRGVPVGGEVRVSLKDSRLFAANLEPLDAPPQKPAVKKTPAKKAATTKKAATKRVARPKREGEAAPAKAPTKRTYVRRDLKASE